MDSCALPSFHESCWNKVCFEAQTPPGMPRGQVLYSITRFGLHRHLLFGDQASNYSIGSHASCYSPLTNLSIGCAKCVSTWWSPFSLCFSDQTERFCSSCISPSCLHAPWMHFYRLSQQLLELGFQSSNYNPSILFWFRCNGIEVFWFIYIDTHH